MTHNDRAADDTRSAAPPQRRAASMLRVAAWIVLLLLGALQPGVNALDRWLARGSWDVPSAWNGVADIAIRTGVVDPRIDRTRAPWRRASVAPVGSARVAVVAVSDMHRSRVTFLDEQYRVLGSFDRLTSDTAVVTDETRGYRPLSHVWPLIKREGRLETLVSTEPLASKPPRGGVFAYLSVDTHQTEVLFACELGSGPGPIWGELDRRDLNGDGVEDLVVFLRSRRDVPPLATFIWNDQLRTYAPRLADGARDVLSWWSTTPDDRVIVRRGQPVDEPIRLLLHRGAFGPR